MKNYHGTPEIATVYDAVAHMSFLVSLITHVCTMVLFVFVIVVRRSSTMQRMHISRSCKASHTLFSLSLLVQLTIFVCTGVLQSSLAIIARLIRAYYTQRCHWRRWCVSRF